MSEGDEEMIKAIKRMTDWSIASVYALLIIAAAVMMMM